MGVVLLQILQWILRIILFLLVLILVLLAIVLFVPVRYQAEGELLEKKPCVRGKITWFFYLIYIRFFYEEEFCIQQVRILGIKTFDVANEKSDKKKSKHKRKSKKRAGKKAELKESEDEDIFTDMNEAEDEDAFEDINEAEDEDAFEDINEAEDEDAFEDINEAEDEDVFEDINEAEDENVFKDERDASQEQNKYSCNNEKKTEKTKASRNKEKGKKKRSDIVQVLKNKVQILIQKIKDIIASIREKKIKAEHYLELWNRQDTQVTLKRALNKLGIILKDILPKKWIVTGEVGFEDPASTGRFMGVLGSLYPILGNKVQIVPNFEHEVMKIKGNARGHISLWDLLYPIGAFFLNKHCISFIKMVSEEKGKSSNKKKKKSKKKR